MKSASLADPPGRNRGSQKTPTKDGNSIVEDNITPLFEVVNLRIEEV